MPKRKTRAETVEDNGRRLLDAAARVFARRGYHGASLDQVALAAGLTKGAVYARFSSKAELFLSLLEQRIDERVRQIADAAAGARGSTEAMAEALGRQWAGLNGKEREWQLLLAEFRVHAARDAALNARYRALHARFRKGYADAITDNGGGVPEGMSSEDVVRVGIALATGFTLERWVDGDEFSEDLFVRASVAMVRGLLTQERKPKGARR